MISPRRAALLFAGLLLAAPANSPAQSATPGSPRPIGLADYYRLVTISAPALSPDGRQVVFVRTRVIEAENRRLSELWIAPTDGSGPPSPLTPAGFSASAPQISPDGRLVAFRSGSRIWFLDLTKPTQPSQVSGMTDLPVWSPDGKWMAFTMPTPPPAIAAPPKAESDRVLDQRFTGRIIEWMNYRFDGRGYLTDSRDSAASPPRGSTSFPRTAAFPGDSPSWESTC